VEAGVFNTIVLLPAVTIVVAVPGAATVLLVPFAVWVMLQILIQIKVQLTPEVTAYLQFCHTLHMKQIIAKF